MADKVPDLSCSTRRIEKVHFEFKNPGNVDIEVPVVTCNKTKKKFFHPDDVENILKELDKEYNRVHKKLEK